MRAYRGVGSVALGGALFLLFASVAWLIASLSNDPSAGNLARYSLFPLLLAAILVLVAVSDAPSLKAILAQGRTDIRVVLPLLPLSFLVAYATAVLGSRTANIFFLVGLLALVGSMCAIGLSLIRDDSWGLAVFLVTYPLLAFLEWDRSSRLDLVDMSGPLVISPSIIVLWALFAATTLGQVSRKREFARNSLQKYVLIWAGLLLVSALASTRPTESFQEFFLEGLTLPLFFWVAVAQITTKASLMRMVYAIIAFSVLRAALTYYLYVRYASAQHLSGTGVIAGIGESDVAIYSAIAHNDFLAWVTAFPLPLILALILGNTRSRTKVVLASILVFLVFILFISNRRAPFLAYAIILPLMAADYFKAAGRFRLALPTLVVVLTAVLVYQASVDAALLRRFGEWGSLRDFSSEQRWRLDAFQASLGIIKDHPLLGIGLGAWTDYYPSYSQYHVSGRWLQDTMNKPHNMFLQYAVAGGVGAVAAWIALLIAAIRKGIRARFHTMDADIQFAARGLLWSVLMIALTGALGGANSLVMKSWALTAGLDGGLLFWTFLGAIVALERIGPLEARSAPTAIVLDRPGQVL